MHSQVLPGVSAHSGHFVTIYFVVLLFYKIAVLARTARKFSCIPMAIVLLSAIRRPTILFIAKNRHAGQLSSTASTSITKADTVVVNAGVAFPLELGQELPPNSVRMKYTDSGFALGPKTTNEIHTKSNSVCACSSQLNVVKWVYCLCVFVNRTIPFQSLG